LELPAPSAHAGCAFIVVWHDRAYWGSGGGPAQASPGGTVLEGAVQPGCNDTVGANEHPTPVAARSIPGVPSAVAIFSQGSTFVGSGYFIERYPVGSRGTGVAIVDETQHLAELDVSGASAHRLTALFERVFGIESLAALPRLDDIGEDAEAIRARLVEVAQARAS
jgi:hypothetical protein